MAPSGKQSGASPSEGKPTPWRVEGAPDSEPDAPSPRRSRFAPPGGRWFWVVLLVALAVNSFLGSRVAEEKERLSVPYTFFRSEVDRGNVEEISTRGDTIQGEFKATVRYPARARMPGRRSCSPPSARRSGTTGCSTC